VSRKDLKEELYKIPSFKIWVEERESIKETEKKSARNRVETRRASLKLWL
jgi:hypothetical protein